METSIQLRELAQKITILTGQPVLTTLEQDLLRSYLLQMYDAVVNQAGNSQSAPQKLDKPSAEVIMKQELVVPVINDIPVSQNEIYLPQEPEIEEEIVEALNLFSSYSFETEKVEIDDAESVIEPKEEKEVSKVSEVTKITSPKNVIELLKSENADEEKLIDRIAQEQKTLAHKIQITPIDNIKSHITLNKKVAYIIGLFNQESEDYNKALDQLNTADNLQDALNTMHTLRSRYNWKPDLDLAKELEQLVRRRYTTSI
jgi:organic radical activating enzyme